MATPSLLSLGGLFQFDRGTPQWAARVNAQVAARFDSFAANLALTPNQQQEAAARVRDIVACLNTAYWNSASNTDNFIAEGSWGKGTQTRPPRDVDILYVLPSTAYFQFQQRAGNIQSQLLQDVKQTLEARHPNTRMRGDNQVVVVDFADGHGVEVVPAFLTSTAGGYLICNTKYGGSYKTIYPFAEIGAVQVADRGTGGAATDVIKMVKRWQHHCNVPLKSFQLELLVLDLLPTLWYQATGTRGLRDWIIRDFFELAIRRANTSVTIPGSGEQAFLGDDWLPRARSAYATACLASAYEEGELSLSAGQEWLKIFGPDI